MPSSDQGISTDRYMLIPRVLIFLTRGDTVLLLKGAPTKRLWANQYNGIGGHVERGEDVLSAARRELMEEVAIDDVKDAPVAVISDDSTEVGWVHFGVVHVVHVSGEDVAGRRSGIVGPEFIAVEEAVKNLSGYESWSRFCLERLDSLLSKAAAPNRDA